MDGCTHLFGVYMDVRHAFGVFMDVDTFLLYVDTFLLCMDIHTHVGTYVGTHIGTHPYTCWYFLVVLSCCIYLDVETFLFRSFPCFIWM